MRVAAQPTTILLIDDSASVLEVLRVALESEGYAVLEAADGREGVRMFREHRPALVIADIVMPEKDGIETVREILAIDPAAIILTMSGRDEDFQEVAMRLGARRGFRKPVLVGLAPESRSAKLESGRGCISRTGGLA